MAFSERMAEQLAALLGRERGCTMCLVPFGDTRSIFREVSIYKGSKSKKDPFRGKEDIHQRRIFL